MNIQPYLDFATGLAYRAGRITLECINTSIRPDFNARHKKIVSLVDGKE
jgi:hypothetical protein